MLPDKKTLTNVADTNHRSLPCSIRVSSVASFGFRVLCVLLWQLNQAALAAKERKERKRGEMKWPLAIGDFVRCAYFVVRPAFPKRFQAISSVPFYSQAPPNAAKRFPNDSQTSPILCLIGFALNAWPFSEKNRDRRPNVFCTVKKTRGCTGRRTIAAVSPRFGASASPIAPRLSSLPRTRAAARGTWCRQACSKLIVPGVFPAQRQIGSLLGLCDIFRAAACLAKGIACKAGRTPVESTTSSGTIFGICPKPFGGIRMRTLNRIHRTSLWPVLTVACGLLVSIPASRGDDAAGGEIAAPTAKTDSKTDKAKKAEDSMQKAMQDAQSAYEKEQRDLKDRLEKDPAWQPSHENVAVIKPGKGPIESFCRNKDGNLLICCSGEQPSLLGGLLGGGGNSHKGEIAVFSPEGKSIADWKMPFPTQAICLGGDGTIYVAGGGRIAKLDESGKVIAQVDTPNSRELPPVPEVKKEPKKEGPEAEAAEKAEEGKDRQLDQGNAAGAKGLHEGRPRGAEGTQAQRRRIDASISGKAQGADGKTASDPAGVSRSNYDARDAGGPGPRNARADGDRDGHGCNGSRSIRLLAQTKGFGYTVWRTDHDFANPKKIVENLAGCCSQMDIQAHGGDLWVAHNSRHKVEHYSREGKKLGSFGKTDRVAADGFGGCCEPKNLRFGTGDVVLCCESGPPTCVKRYTLAGKFIGVSLVAPWNSGCAARDDGIRRRPRPLFRAQQRRPADPRLCQEAGNRSAAGDGIAQAGQERELIIC